MGVGCPPPGGFLLCLGHFLIRLCRLRAMEGEVRAELSIQPSLMLSLLPLRLPLPLPESQRKSKAEALGSSQGSSEWGLLKGPWAFMSALGAQLGVEGRGCPSRVLWGCSAETLVFPSV